MPKFKVGDRVRVVDGRDYPTGMLVNGAVHQVRRVDSGGRISLVGLDYVCLATRFELIDNKNCLTDADGNRHNAVALSTVLQLIEDHEREYVNTAMVGGSVDAYGPMNEEYVKGLQNKIRRLFGHDPDGE